MTRKEVFIQILAKYLTENQAVMSIKLGLGYEEAKDWFKLRMVTPVFGYMTQEEAEKVLTEFLA